MQLLHLFIICFMKEYTLCPIYTTKPAVAFIWQNLLIFYLKINTTAKQHVCVRCVWCSRDISSYAFHEIVVV